MHRRRHGSGLQLVRRMVKRRGSKAGINDLHPHILRHTCATAWIAERRLELHEVQLLLGHARLTTTQRYDRRGEESKRKAAALISVPYQRARGDEGESPGG